MNLQNHLEILLITYNRKPFLQKTFKQLLADNSPVKDLDITVLDNCSTDGTNQYLNELCTKHPNIKHICHNRNIGGNANIARAFELAKKDYFWILADDDCYDFSAWQQVENAFKENPDIIIVNTEYTQGDGTFPKMYRLLTFLPAAIYKTTNITPQVLTNIYNNIPNWFPHLAAVAEVINKNGKVITIKENIVKRVKSKNDYIDLKNDTDLESKTLPAINRIMPNLPPSQKYKFLEIGYYKSCELIKAPKKRAKAVEACHNNVPFWRQMISLITWNNIGCNNYKENYTTLKHVFNCKQKIIFNLLYLCSYFFIPYYYQRKKKENKRNETLKERFIH